MLRKTWAVALKKWRKMMNSWEIIPFESVGPVKFGINAEEAAKLIGEPKSDRPRNSYKDYKDYVRLFFRPDVVDEVSISGDSQLDISIFNMNIFRDEKQSVLQRLERENGGPVYESNGFLFFKKFGMLLTGIHDDDDAQKAVSLSAYDGFIEYFGKKEQARTLNPISFL